MDNMPPPPEVAPKPKTPLTLIVGIALAAVVAGFVLANAFGSGTEESASSGASPSAVAPSEEVSCVDAALAERYTMEAVGNLEDARAAMNLYDVDSAVAYLRDAGSSLRASLEAIHNMPEVASLIGQAADEYDQAADDLAALRLDASAQHLDNATRYVDQATAAVQGGVDCAYA